MVVGPSLECRLAAAACMLPNFAKRPAAVAVVRIEIDHIAAEEVLDLGLARQGNRIEVVPMNQTLAKGWLYAE